MSRNKGRGFGSGVPSNRRGRGGRNRTYGRGGGVPSFRGGGRGGRYNDRGGGSGIPYRGGRGGRRSRRPRRGGKGGNRGRGGGVNIRRGSGFEGGPPTPRSRVVGGGKKYYHPLNVVFVVDQTLNSTILEKFGECIRGVVEKLKEFDRIALVTFTDEVSPFFVKATEVTQVFSGSHVILQKFFGDVVCSESRQGSKRVLRDAIYRGWEMSNMFYERKCQEFEKIHPSKRIDERNPHKESYEVIVLSGPKPNSSEEGSTISTGEIVNDYLKETGVPNFHSTLVCCGAHPTEEMKKLMGGPNCSLIHTLGSSGLEKGFQALQVDMKKRFDNSPRTGIDAREKRREFLERLKGTGRATAIATGPRNRDGSGPRKRTGSVTRPKTGTIISSKDVIDRCVFMGGVNNNMSQKQVMGFFSSHGIKLAKIFLPPLGDGSRKNRGFAYVQFEDKKNVELAMRLQGKKMNNKLFEFRVMQRQKIDECLGSVRKLKKKQQQQQQQQPEDKLLSILKKMDFAQYYKELRENHVKYGDLKTFVKDPKCLEDFIKRVHRERFLVSLKQTLKEEEEGEEEEVDVILGEYNWKGKTILIKKNFAYFKNERNPFECLSSNAYRIRIRDVDYVFIWDQEDEMLRVWRAKGGFKFIKRVSTHANAIGEDQILGEYDWSGKSLMIGKRFLFLEEERFKYERTSSSVYTSQIGNENYVFHWDGEDCRLGVVGVEGVGFFEKIEKKTFITTIIT